jgi:hypothetical protein
VRIFKREAPAFWVDIYFFGSKAADAFNPDQVPGVLRWSRIGTTQIQVLTTNHRLLEAAAKEHERAQLELVRQQRLEQLAAMAEADAEAKSGPKKSAGGFEEVVPRAASVAAPAAQSGPKKKPCRGCGKK